jgi:preprotein translocase subunit Sec63
MPEPVRFARISEAYSSGVNVYLRQRQWDAPVRDKVEISNEAQQKAKEYLSKIKDESSSENSASIAQTGESDDILSLPASAPIDEIRKAYLAAIKQYHPDNFASFSPEFRKLAEEKSKQINLAYKKLTSAATP